MIRAEVRKLIKLAEGMNPNREDGNMTDEYINIAIDEAIKIVARDCNLLPVRRSFAKQANVWQYPLDEDVNSIRALWYIDSNGTRIELHYISPEQFLDFVDPEVTSDQPSYFSYPVFENEVVQLFASALMINDYIPQSYITEGTIRTLVDSGINLGKTLYDKRIQPGFVVHNLSDSSYGIVEVLDISTPKVTSTMTINTTTDWIEDTNVNFQELNVSIGDIICSPSDWVTSYAFVTEVQANRVKYADIQGAVKRFKRDDTYKIGQGTQIRLSMAQDHPGLRWGSNNVFTLGSETANITATTFTYITCTGTIIGTPAIGEIAIADSGQHGKITAVNSGSITVDMWIGSIPADGAVISTKSANMYQIEDGNSNVRSLWLGPPVEEADTIPNTSIELLFNKRPKLPSDDNDTLEIPDDYRELLVFASRWQVAILSGKIELAQEVSYRRVYKEMLAEFAGDIFRPPMSKPLNMWRNKSIPRRVARYTTRSGHRWTPLDS